MVRILTDMWRGLRRGVAGLGDEYVWSFLVLVAAVVWLAALAWIGGAL